MILPLADTQRSTPEYNGTPGYSVVHHISIFAVKLLTMYLIFFFAGSVNDCKKPSIIINELNMENPDTGSKEFIELYDGGQGSTALDSLILVLFSGINGGRAYKTIPLHGHNTDE